MASNWILIDQYASSIRRIVPIADESEEARQLERIANQLKEDIDYIVNELKNLRNRIHDLQIEVFV